MNYLNRLLAVASAAFFIAGSALAQNAGTVTNHAFALGKGAGTTGYTSLLCGSAQLAVGQSAADPICRTITGDVTITAAGVTAIGTAKVVTAMLALNAADNTILAQMANGTIKCRNTAGTGNPEDCTAAQVRTILALVIGTNVEAWDADLDCLGALSGTGILRRTGAGTCSNGTAVANAELATMAANTIKANATGSAAVPTDVSIPALTQKVSPVAADKIMIADSAASDALKYATVSSLASAGSVASLNGQTGALVSYFKPQGRLTLATLTPVMTASVPGSTTVYYTPYQGNMVPIYDGTNMVPTAVAEVSQLTTDATKSPAAVAASKVYDVFVWNDAGTIRATRGPAWTNSTTRGYTFTMVNGIQLNTTAITNGPGASRGTWVGTIASNASSTIDYIFGASASGGTAAVLNVWNTYNRVSTPTTVTDSGASYTYAIGTIRQARSSAGNQIAFVIGAQEESVQFSYSADFSTGAVLNNAASCGVGFNTTTTYSSTPMGIQTVAAVAQEQAFSSAGVWAAPIGTNVLSANESSVVGTSTFNAAGYSIKNMLMATIRN